MIEDMPDIIPEKVKKADIELGVMNKTETGLEKLANVYHSI